MTVVQGLMILLGTFGVTLCVGSSLLKAPLLNVRDEGKAPATADGLVRRVVRNDQERDRGNAPCRSDAHCEDETTVCITHTGTCESCVVFEVNAPSLPQRCIDYFDRIGDKPHSAGDTSENKEGRRCYQETDCKLGRFCVEDTGTCENCTELQSQHNKELYEKYCAGWIKYQEEEATKAKDAKTLNDKDEDANKRKAIYAAVFSSLAFILLLCLGGFLVCWCKQRRQRQQNDNGNREDVAYTNCPIIAHPEDVDNVATETAV